MVSVIALLLSLVATSAAIKDSDPYHAWLLRQIAQSEAQSKDPAAAAMSVVWRHELCAGDTACDERVAASAETSRAYALAGQHAALLTLLANADALTSDSARLLRRMSDIANADTTNSYPLAIVAAIHWKRAEHEAAHTALIEAAAKPAFDDYYTSNSAAAMHLIEAHPPAASELAPCIDSDDETIDGPDPRGRVMAATFSLMGSVGFSKLGDLVAMCKAAGNGAGAHDMREACDHLGATMDAKAGTLLSRNMGVALRRVSTSNELRKAEFIRQLSDNSERVQRGMWWTQKQSPVRVQAESIWMDAFNKGGEIAAAAALERTYGPPPELRAEREAREQRNMTDGIACYARLKAARAARARVP